MPRLPSKRRRQSGKDSGTVIAIAGVLIISCGFLGFMAMVAPNLLVIPALGIGLGLFIAFHYLVWGKWLTNHLNKLPDDE